MEENNDFSVLLDKVFYQLQDLDYVMPEGFTPAVELFSDGSGRFLLHGPEQEEIMGFDTLEEACEKTSYFIKGLKLGLRIGKE